MGWFKKNKEEKEERDLPELPKLPELPELPDLDLERKNPKEKLPKLPSFPTNSLGQRFSQDAIKEAVRGKRGDNGRFAEDFDDEDLEVHLPYQKIKIKEMGEEIKMPKKKPVLNREPIFIRIDKFEDGMNTFKKAKIKITEIENMLKDIRHLKNQEEKELVGWEAEIQAIKAQIQKVDTDVFSKIE